MRTKPPPKLTAEQIAALWRKDDRAKAMLDDAAQQPDRDPWRLEMTPQQAALIQRNNPYLWRQLIERGFIDAQGRASDAWQADPRHRPQRSGKG